jgi:hypothetical protein
MATLVAGDTLSLYNLGQATGQGTTNISLGTIKGSPTAGDNIELGADFAIDTVGAITGFTYAVENTTETYTLGFSGAGTHFSSTIGSTPSNFTWSVPAGSYITVNTNSGATASFNIASMNPQSPSAQSVLQSIQTNTIRVNFADGFNDHIGSGDGYGVNKDKTVYSVDSYDGNSTALCLTLDTIVTLEDGTTIEIGNVEEGMKLKGFSLSGLGTQEGDYLEWYSSELNETEEIVTVKNVVFSFTQKIYNVNNGQINATGEHPFLVKDVNDNNFRFKKVSSLVLGDKLIKFEENSLNEILIESIVEETGVNEIVTIDVEEQDTYLANGFITHNKGGNSHTDLGNPGTPQSFAYTDVNATNKNLTWAAGTSSGTTGVTAYDIDVDDNSDFSSPVYSFSEYSSTTLNVAGLTPGVTYYARVRAIDHGLKSGYATLTFTR